MIKKIKYAIVFLFCSNSKLRMDDRCVYAIFMSCEISVGKSMSHYHCLYTWVLWLEYVKKLRAEKFEWKRCKEEIVWCNFWSKIVHYLHCTGTDHMMVSARKKTPYPHANSFFFSLLFALYVKQNIENYKMFNIWFIVKSMNPHKIDEKGMKEMENGQIAHIFSSIDFKSVVVSQYPFNWVSIEFIGR